MLAFCWLFGQVHIPCFHLETAYYPNRQETQPVLWFAFIKSILLLILAFTKELMFMQKNSDQLHPFCFCDCLFFSVLELEQLSVMDRFYQILFIVFSKEKTKQTYFPQIPRENINTIYQIFFIAVVKNRLQPYFYLMKCLPSLISFIFFGHLYSGCPVI